MLNVEFTIATAPKAGTASMTFDSISEMRDWFRSVFFSNTYRVRGADRHIIDDNGQVLGCLM